MPVSRNFSLPSSVEARNKTRQETRNARSEGEFSLKKFIRPKALLSTYSNNSNNVVTSVSGTGDTDNQTRTEYTCLKEARMGVGIATTQGETLSQPCLPVSLTTGATRIFPHLYLGSQKDVVDEKMMRRKGITYVLNVSKRCEQPNFIDDIHFHRISVGDNYQEKITPHMLDAIEFIEQVRKSNQRVLVHCLAGVSRSATVAIAYVLHYLRIGFEDAYRFVKEKRPSISPNFNFLGQLMEFEQSLRESGHMDSKQTGSLLGDRETEDKFICLNEDLKMKDSNLRNTSPEYSPLFMPATCSYICTTSPNSEAIFPEKRPISLFCRRQNGPNLPKLCYSSRTSESICATTTARHICATSENKLSDDASIAIPSSPQHNEDSCGLDSDRNNTNKESTPISVMCMCNVRGNYDTNFLKPHTAPNTPVIGRPRIRNTELFQSINSPKVVTRHRRCVSGGEITNLTSFNMKRRFDPRSIDDIRKENSLNNQFIKTDFCPGFKEGPSFFGGSYFEPSSKALHKFVPFHYQNPKTLRKSQNLITNSKSETALTPNTGGTEDLWSEKHVPKFDFSHSWRTPTKGPLRFSSKADRLDSSHRNDLNNVSNIRVKTISTLTLSSPNTEKNANPLLQVPEYTPSTSQDVCRVLNGQFTSDDLHDHNPTALAESLAENMCTDSLNFASSANSHRRPFILSAGRDLELCWRKGDCQRKSADSCNLSLAQTSQSCPAFTSPVSPHNVFETSESLQGNMNYAPLENGEILISKGHFPCHMEGAFVSSSTNDGTNSNMETEKRKNSPVGRPAGVEIMSCS